jgi:hypothetical protein
MAIAAAQELVNNLAARQREFADRLADRQSQVIPAEDPDYEPLAPGVPRLDRSLQGCDPRPPKPQIQASQRILERSADHDPHRSRRLIPPEPTQIRMLQIESN